MIYLLPTIYGGILSFGHGEQASTGGATLRWYQAFAENPRLLTALQRSILSAAFVAVTVVALLIAGLKSYASYSPRAQKSILALLLVPLFVPETTHALTLSGLLIEVGLPKGAFAVFLGQLAYVLPYVGVFILLQVLALPPNLFLATRDIGMGWVIQTMRVILPLMWPTLVSALVFSFFLALNEYTRTLYLEADEYYSVYLTSHLNSGGNRAIYAASTLLCGLGSILFIISTGMLYRRGQQWRIGD